MYIIVVRRYKNNTIRASIERYNIVVSVFYFPLAPGAHPSPTNSRILYAHTHTRAHSRHVRVGLEQRRGASDSLLRASTGVSVFRIILLFQTESDLFLFPAPAEMSNRIKKFTFYCYILYAHERNTFRRHAPPLLHLYYIVRKDIIREKTRSRICVQVLRIIYFIIEEVIVFVGGGWGKKNTSFVRHTYYSGPVSRDELSAVDMILLLI